MTSGEWKLQAISALTLAADPTASKHGTLEFVPPAVMIERMLMRGRQDSQRHHNLPIYVISIVFGRGLFAATPSEIDSAHKARANKKRQQGIAGQILQPGRPASNPFDALERS